MPITSLDIIAATSVATAVLCGRQLWRLSNISAFSRHLQCRIMALSTPAMALLIIAERLGGEGWQSDPDQNGLITLLIAAALLLATWLAARLAEMEAAAAPADKT